MKRPRRSGVLMPTNVGTSPFRPWKTTNRFGEVVFPTIDMDNSERGAANGEEE